MTPHLELGLDTFGDVTRDRDGRPLHQAHVLRDVVAEAVLADVLGVDAFGVGEHHRPDFAVSAPEVVLAAIAGRTTRIRLGSAAGTSRGFGVAEFREVGRLIVEVLDGLAKNGEAGNAATEAAVKARAIQLCQRFPIYA